MEILRETVPVALDLFVEALGLYAVKGGQVGIEDHRVSPDADNHIAGRNVGGQGLAHDRSPWAFFSTKASSGVGTGVKI